MDLKELQPYLVAMVGAALGLIAARLRPRAQKQKEAADAGVSAANEQNTWQEAYGELRELYISMTRAYDRASSRITLLEHKQAALSRRQDSYEVHLDDVYTSIHAEGEEAELRIFSRVKSQRPSRNGE